MPSLLNHMLTPSYGLPLADLDTSLILRIPIGLYFILLPHGPYLTMLVTVYLSCI